MNEAIAAFARELAKQINQVVDLPFMNEEEEELFFQVVVLKVFEIAFGKLIKR
ncbi:MAG: hypothetical protein FJ042_07305 [Candidatus Cloacimonetes bacterium]|nr:hypothetical protein [Candidatus Cloacimonadota bacterium]